MHSRQHVSGGIVDTVNALNVLLLLALFSKVTQELYC